MRLHTIGQCNAKASAWVCAIFFRIDRETIAVVKDREKGTLLAT
jgi:hypothetical protein